MVIYKKEASLPSSMLNLSLLFIDHLYHKVDHQDNGEDNQNPDQMLNCSINQVVVAQSRK